MCRWMTKFRGNSRFYAETGSEVVIKSYVDEKSRGNHWFLCQKQQQQPVARATEGRPEREETSDPRATLREHDYVTNIEIIRWLRNIIRNHIDLSHLMSLVTEARSRMWYLILTLNFILWFDWLLLMTTTYSPFYFSEVISIYIPSTDRYECDSRITWNPTAFVCRMCQTMRLEVKSKLVLVLCITTAGE